MRYLKFFSRRILFLFIQLVGVTAVAFFIIRLIPGNPALALAGQKTDVETVAAIERRLGLDKPLPVQYAYFWRDILRGDLGNSIMTGQPVMMDLKSRLPATLEITLSAIVICIIVGIPLGIFAALRKGGFLEKSIFFYGMITGGLPDFWIGLVLIFVFFFLLHWVPAPMGRIGLFHQPPETVTGLYMIDSLIHGDWETFKVAVHHLILPVITLVAITMGSVVKMTRASMEEVAGSEFMDYARACGLSKWRLITYQLRNALAPIVTVIAFTNAQLLGGSVLVEVVFSWSGVGSYAVNAVNQADYWPLQGFVLLAAVFMAINYLVLDIVHILIDPKLELA